MGALLLWQQFNIQPYLQIFLLDIKNHDFFIQLFFQVLATLYAVCTAFLLWKGLTDFDDLRHALRSEADEIQSILNLMSYFDQDPESEQGVGDNAEDTKINQGYLNKLRLNFRDYIANILRDGKITPSQGNFRILRSSVRVIGKLETKDVGAGIGDLFH